MRGTLSIKDKRRGVGPESLEPHKAWKLHRNLRGGALTPVVLNNARKHRPLFSCHPNPIANGNGMHFQRGRQHIEQIRRRIRLLLCVNPAKERDQAQRSQCEVSATYALHPILFRSKDVFPATPRTTAHSAPRRDRKSKGLNEVWKEMSEELARSFPGFPRLSAGYTRVRISGPPGVTAIVCSKCAEGRPSSVTTVQPSSRTFTFSVPRLIIGSIAMTRPGLTLYPFAPWT